MKKTEASLKIRVGREQLGYYNNLDNAIIIRMFDDLAAQLLAIEDGSNGQLVQYSDLQIIDFAQEGDFVEFYGYIEEKDVMSREIVLEARKTILARNDVEKRAAEVLEVPIVISKAVGIWVIPKDSEYK